MLAHLERKTAEEVLAWAIRTFEEALAFTLTFEDEGMVILDMAARIALGLRVVTLDTGRLPEETYQMIETVRSRYGISVEMVLPEAAEVEAMAAMHGPNLFRKSVALRTLCCQVRKVRPLERKMKEFRACVLGLRREQTETRAGIPKVEERERLVRISPLADWTAAQVREYVERQGLPRHPLYARGYTSIGCAPCTRPTVEGEDARDGRWWWEQGAAKECGLHFSPEGRAERRVDVLLREVLERAERLRQTPSR